MIVFGKFHLYRNICFVHPKLLVNIVAVEGDEHPVMTACWDCHRQVLKRPNLKNPYWLVPIFMDARYPELHLDVDPFLRGWRDSIVPILMDPGTHWASATEAEGACVELKRYMEAKEAGVK